MKLKKDYVLLDAEGVGRLFIARRVIFQFARHLSIVSQRNIEVARRLRRSKSACQLDQRLEATTSDAVVVTRDLILFHSRCHPNRGMNE